MPEYVLSAASQEEIKKTIERFQPHPEAATLHVLWIAQRQFGWLPPEALELCAQALSLPAARVEGVASFYTMFKLKPTGKYQVQICRNLSCAMLGSVGVGDRLCKKLGIKLGETTKDGMFTVEHVECLAACGIAPAVQVNEEYHGNMRGEKLDQLVEVLREREKQAKA